MGKRIRDHIDPDEIEGAEAIIGKVLIHVRNLEPKSGSGFAFCFGDKKDDKQGPLVVIRLEDKGDTYSMNLYYKGHWKDKEEVLN